MRIFKLFAVLLLAFCCSSALFGAGTDPAQGDKVEIEAPGFFEKLFSSFRSEEKLVEPEPWNKTIVYEKEKVKVEEEFQEEPNWAEAAARAIGIYLANVGSDLVDIFSVEFSFGNSFALNFHITSLFDLGVENSDTLFIGTGHLHKFGYGRREAQRVNAICWSYEDIYVSKSSKYMPAYSMKDTSFNLVRCYTDAFKDSDIDYLAIGGRFAMFFGFAFDLHLAAVPDFFCSLAGFDLFGDNWK